MKIMKALYLNIESSEDVKLAVEMIKSLELDSKEVKTISSPVEELSQAVEAVTPETVVKANTEHENALKEQASVLAEQESKAKAKAEALAELARLEKLAAEKAAAEAAAEQAKLAAEAEAKAVAKAKADKEEAEAKAEQAKAAQVKAREAAKEAKALADAAAAEKAANEEAEAAKEAEKAAKEARFEDRRTADPDTGVSFEMIRIKASNRARRGDLTRERMAEILAKFNARSLTQVKKSDYGQLYADLD